MVLLRPYAYMGSRQHVGARGSDRAPATHLPIKFVAITPSRLAMRADRRLPEFDLRGVADKITPFAGPGASVSL